MKLFHDPHDDPSHVGRVDPNGALIQWACPECDAAAVLFAGTRAPYCEDHGAMERIGEYEEG